MVTLVFSSFACGTGKYVPRAPHCHPTSSQALNAALQGSSRRSWRMRLCIWGPTSLVWPEWGGHGSGACVLFHVPPSLSGPPAADSGPPLAGDWLPPTRKQRKNCPQATLHPYRQRISTGTKAKNGKISWESILIWNFLLPSKAGVLTFYSAWATIAVRNGHSPINSLSHVFQHLK